MKKHPQCDEAQKLILLEEAGELSLKDVSRLQNHLASCETCSEYKSTYTNIILSYKNANITEAPSEDAIKQVLSQATFLREKEKASRHSRRSLPMLAALAATLTILLAARFIFVLNPRANSNETAPLIVAESQNGNYAARESRIKYMHSLLDLVSEEDIDNTALDNGATKSLADRLLILEGFDLPDTLEI